MLVFQRKLAGGEPQAINQTFTYYDRRRYPRGPRRLGVDEGQRQGKAGNEETEIAVEEGTNTGAVEGGSTTTTVDTKIGPTEDGTTSIAVGTSPTL